MRIPHAWMALASLCLSLRANVGSGLLAVTSSTILEHWSPLLQGSSKDLGSEDLRSDTYQLQKVSSPCY
jgi:hypothetical protein